MKFFLNKNFQSGLIISLILWLLIWAGYNTYPRTLDFSNFLDFFHSFRAFFPLLAGFFALLILFSKKHSFSFKILRTPFGLLALYTFFGIISSIFLSLKPLLALYWAFAYGSVIIVLFAILTISESKSHLPLLINLNWVIVFILASGLFLFFLSQPGVISSLAGNFLSGRPYEGLAGVPAEIETFGMPGTRPTGFGRYAAIGAILALARTILDKERKKFLWYFLFLISFSLLIFSQAKTAILAFVFCFFLIFLLKSKSKFATFGWSLFSLFQLILVSLYLFYIPLIYTPQLLEKITPPEEKIAVAKLPPEAKPSPEVEIVTPPEFTSRISVLTTLGGRTTGIWPQAWQLFLKSPLIGWGFHADRIFLKGQHAHNAILHSLIQAGIIGTILFVSAFFWAWVILFKLLRKSSLTEKPFLIEIAGIMAFFMIRGITESTGAFFGADFLILAPVIAYLQNLWFQKKSDQLKS